jgi:hypothetical protein
MMSEKFSITKFVPELLNAHPEQRFTAREIARWIMETYPSATQNKRSASTAKKITLGVQSRHLVDRVEDESIWL